MDYRSILSSVLLVKAFLLEHHDANERLLSALEELTTSFVAIELTAERSSQIDYLPITPQAQRHCHWRHKPFSCTMGPDVGAPRGRSRKIFRPKPPGGNQVVPGISIIQRPDKAEPLSQWPALAIAPALHYCPMKVSTALLRPLSLYFVAKGAAAEVTGGKNRILRHLHPRKNLQTTVLPRTFGSVRVFGDSEESYGVPPNAHLSDGSSSGTSAGDSRCSVSGQPSCISVYDLFITDQGEEEPKPEWDGNGLRASTTRHDNIMEEALPVLLHVNPRRGSTSGGEEIYLIVKNLPSTAVLYARFGCNIAPTSHIANGVLACHLPPGTHPGVVDVTLCQAPSVHEKSYGESLVSFEYDANTSKAVALLSTLLSGTHFTEVKPATQGVLQGSTQGPTIESSDPTHSVSINPPSFPESAFIEVLAAFESLPDFEQRLSTVNTYQQSLLHLAVHLRYRELVQRLVDWGIDLNIKDMNGFTALHTAYLCGDPSITRMLEQSGAIQLSLDILGRPPLELASGTLEDHNTESHLNNHF